MAPGKATTNGGEEDRTAERLGPNASCEMIESTLPLSLLSPSLSLSLSLSLSGLAFTVGLSIP